MKAERDVDVFRFEGKKGDKLRVEAQAGETWREKCECRHDSAGIGYLWVRDCRYVSGSGEKRCGPCDNNITRC